jgi:hypothetical protein
MIPCIPFGLVYCLWGLSQWLAGLERDNYLIELIDVVL